MPDGVHGHFEPERADMRHDEDTAKQVSVGGVATYPAIFSSRAGDVDTGGVEVEKGRGCAVAERRHYTAKKKSDMLDYFVYNSQQKFLLHDGQE